MTIYRACSGQSSRRAYGYGSNYDWGICLHWDVERFMPWWRARTADGKQRKFKTHAAAEKAARQLEAAGPPAELVARMREHEAAESAGVRLYGDGRASVWL